MDREIGEIFTYEGKTYQVVKVNIGIGCIGCAFKTSGCSKYKSFLGHCSYAFRRDKIGIIFKEINNMEIKNNQLNIDIPEGMEIDSENSDLTKGIIKFKPKYITYNDIVNFANSIDSINALVHSGDIFKLEAIKQLMSIARYYNKGWKPDWNNDIEFKYHIVFDYFDDMYKTRSKSQTCNNAVYFAHREDAQAVISNPNFREILDTIYK